MYELQENNFSDFFKVPFLAYGRESLYVSPLKSDLKRFLDKDQNPLFKYFGDMNYFTVRKDGRPIGRIVAHVHHKSNERHQLNRGYFGYFDCINDIEAARMLLGAAEEWAGKRGFSEISGNFNLTAMQQIGVMTNGFENAPYTDHMYNPPHIPEILKALGYEAFFPMTTFEQDVTAFDPETLAGPKIKANLSAPELSWRKLKGKDFEKLMRDSCYLLNVGLDENPLFVPLTYEEYLFQAKDMMWIMDERVSAIVYQQAKDSELPVGVIACVPDVNPLLKKVGSQLGITTPYHFLKYRMNRKRAITIFASVDPKMWSSGLISTMYYQLLKALKEAGYERHSATWIGDENHAALRIMEKLQAKPLHRLHLFRKAL